MNFARKPEQNYASQPHILVVDDDLRIRTLISRYLTEHKFLVLTAANAEEARKLLSRFEFDILVIDIMMPGENGLKLTESLRKKCDTPIVLLTALGEAEDRITGLEAGADDYLPKPFEPRELVLRLQTIMRRKPKEPDSSKTVRIGPWIFNPDLRQLENNTDQITLTETETILIQTLAQHAGQPVSREKLAEASGIDAGERTIDVQITRLRRKIEENTRHPRYLQTARGKGYLLRTDNV